MWVIVTLPYHVTQVVIHRSSCCHGWYLFVTLYLQYLNTDQWKVIDLFDKVKMWFWFLRGFNVQMFNQTHSTVCTCLAGQIPRKHGSYDLEPEFRRFQEVCPLVKTTKAKRVRISEQILESYYLCLVCDWVYI